MSLTTRIGQLFRVRRMNRFLREFEITPDTCVLDVGGTPHIWASLPVHLRPRITFLNFPHIAGHKDERDHVVFGNGCQLPFADHSFDIAFSNSVIEHVGSPEAQRQFAEEVKRVGRAYWVQTPNRHFPVEQHLLTPIIHWLPKSWQRAIVPRFTVWRIMVAATADQRKYFLQHYLRDIHLLTALEVCQLFPEARLIRERLLGWTKSLVVFGRTVEADAQVRSSKPTLASRSQQREHAMTVSK